MDRTGLRGAPTFFHMVVIGLCRDSTEDQATLAGVCITQDRTMPLEYVREITI